MSFVSNLFRYRMSEESIAQKSTGMNAKEKQLAFIKDAFKPLLKSEGYRTAGNKWWRIDEPFFNLFELQNFSWNSKYSVDFCFNFTTGLTCDIKKLNAPTIQDGISYIRQNYFKVEKNDYSKGKNGYHIDDNTDLDKFAELVINDFRQLILPKFNLLTTSDPIIAFYSDGFWSPRVRQSLAQGTKIVKIDD